MHRPVSLSLRAITHLLYNGFKIKAAYGGPATPEQIEAVEKLILKKADKPAKSDDFVNEGLIVFADFEKLYLDDLRAKN